MSDQATSSTIRRTSLLALTPIWDSDAEPLVIRAGRPLLCGSGSDCDLQVPLDGVQNRHCKLEFRRGSVSIVNVFAPVWINDIPVSPGARIRPGDQVAIGSATFRTEPAQQENYPPGSVAHYTSMLTGRPLNAAGADTSRGTAN